VRLDLRIPGRAEPILLAAQLAVVTTVLFILSRSTWLTLIAHLVLAVAIPWWVRWMRSYRRPHDLPGD
jgi:Flp pilus assembly protein TadB